MDSFTKAYFAAALWSTTDESRDDGGDPLDDNYSISDFSEDTKRRMIRDCESFQRRAAKLIDSDTPEGEYSADERAGHDFWLTRNGHGAGFWDGGWPKYGDALSKIAKEYGGFDLYVGDDGEIHGSGGREVTERRGVAASRGASSPRGRVSESGEITARTVLDELGRTLEHAGKDAPREAARIARLINRSGYNSGLAEKTLEEINKILDGHGVEAIRDENAYDGYFGDAIAEYVNMGDTYDATVVFDIRNRTWHITSWGDWYEAYEQERDQECGDEDLDERRGTMNSGRPGWYITGYRGKKRILTSGPFSSKQEADTRLRKLQKNDPDTSWGEPYQTTSGAVRSPTRGVVRAPIARDYEVIDRRDRRVAGPFKSQSEATRAAGSGNSVRFVPSKRVRSPARMNEWVPPELSREGIHERELEILLHGMGEFAGGKVPRAGDNVVYDKAYQALLDGGYIVLKRKTQGLSSFGDYYVLTDKGADVLRRHRMAVRAIGTPSKRVRSPAQLMRTRSTVRGVVKSPKANRSAKKKPAKRRR